MKQQARATVKTKAQHALWHVRALLLTALIAGKCCSFGLSVGHMAHFKHEHGNQDSGCSSCEPRSFTKRSKMSFVSELWMEERNISICRLPSFPLLNMITGTGNKLYCKCWSSYSSLFDKGRGNFLILVQPSSCVPSTESLLYTVKNTSMYNIFDFSHQILKSPHDGPLDKSLALVNNLWSYCDQYLQLQTMQKPSALGMNAASCAPSFLGSWISSRKWLWVCEIPSGRCFCF